MSAGRKTKRMKRRYLGALALTVACAAGCNKKEAQPEGKAGEAAQGQVAPGAQPVKAATLEAPADVMAYGGASMGDLLSNVGAVAQAVTGQAIPAQEMAIGSLQSELRLDSTKGLDPSGAIRVAFFNEKTYRKGPMAAVLAITDQKAFAESLPKKYLKQDDAGNAYSYLKYEGASTPVYVNFIDKFAVITRAPDLFAKHGDFFKSLAQAPLQDEASMIFLMDHIAAIHKEELAAGFAEMRREMTASLKQMENNAAERFTTGMVDFMERSLGETQAIHVNVAVDKDGAQLKLKMSPKAGAALGKLFTQLEGKAMSLMGRFPADTPFFYGFNLPPELMAEFATAVSDLLTGALKDNGQMAAAMSQMMGLFTGEMVLAAPPAPEGKGLVLSAILGLKAGKGGELPALMKKMYADPAYQAQNAAMGVKVEFTENAYEINGVPVSVSNSKMENLPPEAMGMAGMLESFTQQHFAATDDLMYVGYGPDGKTALTAMLEGKMGGGLDKTAGVQRALKYAAPNPFGLIYVSPVELAKRMSLGGMNPFAPMLQDIASETGLTISMGAANGEMLMVIDVPTEMAQKSYQAVEKGKGAF